MLEKKLLPYEFMARWTDGKLAGAHVGFITQIVENGVVLSSTAGEVMPVDVGSGKGYPLADIMSQLHIDALVEVETAKAELASAVAEKEKAVEAQASERAKVEEATAALVAAQAELAKAQEAAKAPVDVVA